MSEVQTPAERLKTIVFLKPTAALGSALTLPALHLRVADLPRGTGALRPPPDDSALRIRPARSGLQAGVAARLVGPASLARLAVRVLEAFVLAAGLGGLTLEAVRTEAERAVVGDAAEGVEAARRAAVGAGVAALAVEAGALVGTVCVRAAARQAGAGHADEPRRAAAGDGALDAAAALLAALPAVAVRVGAAPVGAVAHLVTVAGAVVRSAAAGRLQAGDQGVPE